MCNCSAPQLDLLYEWTVSSALQLISWGSDSIERGSSAKYQCLMYGRAGLRPIANSKRDAARHARGIATSKHAKHRRLLEFIRPNIPTDRPVLHGAPQLLGDRTGHARLAGDKRAIEREKPVVYKLYRRRFSDAPN